MKPKVKEFESYESYKASQGKSCTTTRLWPTAQAQCKHDFEAFKAFWPPRSKILDVGCGDGYSMDLMRDAWFEPYGVDFYEPKVNRAIQHEHDVEVCDLNKIPYPDEEFDVVYCRHVLEHLVEPLESLKEFHRVLREKGLLSLIVPMQATSSKHVHEIPDIFYVQEIIEEAGFTVLRAGDVKANKCHEAWIWGVK